MWIKTCMKCGFALIQCEVSLGNYLIPKDFYNFDILKRYCIINASFMQIRSNCGHCFNTECKAYKKHQ